jgi:hypothetical protein
VQNYWLNWDKQTSNIIVSYHDRVCVGSCESHELFAVDRALSEDKSIDVALPDRTVESISVKSIRSLRYAQNERTVVLHSRHWLLFKETTLEFGSADKARDFVDALCLQVGKRLTKTTGDAPESYGSVLMVCSIVFSVAFLLAFFHKFRWVALSVPLVCVLGMGAYVLWLETRQRKVVRWTSGANTAFLNRPALRALVACGIFSTVPLLASPYFDDRHGTTALLKAAKNDTLEGYQVSQFLERGALVNQASENGRTPLWWALTHKNYSAALALIENGADVNANDGRLLEHALNHNAPERVVHAMMRRGALEVAEVMAGFDTKHHIVNDTGNFRGMYDRYRTTLR